MTGGEEGLTVIATFLNDSEARIAVSALQAAGFDARILGAHDFFNRPLSGAFVGLRVAVPADEAVEAAAFVNAVRGPAADRSGAPDAAAGRPAQLLGAGLIAVAAAGIFLSWPDDFTSGHIVLIVFSGGLGLCFVLVPWLKQRAARPRGGKIVS